MRAGRTSALAAGLLTAFPTLPGSAADPNIPAAASTAAKPQTAARESLSELDQAVRDLSSLDPAVRKRALDRIAWLGHEAEPAIVDVTLCLNDPQPEVRAYAAKTLWDIDPQSALAAVKTLESLVDSPRPGLRPLAAFFLGTIGSKAESAMPTLKRALANSVSIEQLQIAEAVARINPADPDAVNVLLGGLRDPESGVRFQAAYALGEVSPLHAGRVLPGLAVAMHDQNPEVRQAAELAVMNLEDQRVQLAQAASPSEPQKPQTDHEPAASLKSTWLKPITNRRANLKINRGYGSNRITTEPAGEFGNQLGSSRSRTGGRV